MSAPSAAGSRDSPVGEHLVLAQRADLERRGPPGYEQRMVALETPAEPLVWETPWTGTWGVGTPIFMFVMPRSFPSPGSAPDSDPAYSCQVSRTDPSVSIGLAERKKKGGHEGPRGSIPLQGKRFLV